jgi:hypothetical protein
VNRRFAAGLIVISPIFVAIACETIVTEPSTASSGGEAGHGGGSAASTGVSGGGDDAGTADGAEDGFTWDATPFEGYDLPVPGQYPPPSDMPCKVGGECGGGAQCNPLSGWCCRGDFKEWEAGVVCACGSELGCLPPAVCCYPAGETKPHCAPSAQDCPTP